MGGDDVVKGRVLAPETGEPEFDNHGCDRLVADLFLCAAVPCLGEFEVLSRDVAGLNFLGGAREVLLWLGRANQILFWLVISLLSHSTCMNTPCGTYLR
jgi:hypothetical protein